MATILTKDLRGKIMAAAMKHAFEQREDEWHARSIEIAEELYKHRFARDLARIEELSEDWYVMYDSIAFRHESYTHHNRYNAPVRFADSELPHRTFKLTRSHRFPPYFDDMDVEKGHPCYKILDVHADNWQAIRSAEIALQDELRTLLYSVNSIEKLLVKWPEGEQFIPKIEKHVVQNAVVPHDLTAKINRMLGIVEA